MIIVAFVGTTHAAAMFFAWLVLPQWAAFVVLTGLFISLVAQLRRERSKSSVRLVIEPNGGLSLTQPNGASRAIVKGHVWGNQLIILRGAPPGAWSQRDLMLGPDSAGEAQLRAVRQAVLLAVERSAVIPPSN